MSSVGPSFPLPFQQGYNGGRGAGGSSPPLQPKQPKGSTACKACRAAKRKCGGGPPVPCGPCIARNNVCVYETPDQRDSRMQEAAGNVRPDLHHRSASVASFSSSSSSLSNAGSFVLSPTGSFGGAWGPPQPSNPYAAGPDSDHQEILQDEYDTSQRLHGLGLATSPAAGALAQLGPAPHAAVDDSMRQDPPSYSREQLIEANVEPPPVASFGTALFGGYLASWADAPAQQQAATNPVRDLEQQVRNAIRGETNPVALGFLEAALALVQRAVPSSAAPAS